jgi:Rab-GTPase-TBC domain
MSDSVPASNGVNTTELIGKWNHIVRQVPSWCRHDVVNSTSTSTSTSSPTSLSLTQSNSHKWKWTDSDTKLCSMPVIPHDVRRASLGATLDMTQHGIPVSGESFPVTIDPFASTPPQGSALTTSESDLPIQSATAIHSDADHIAADDEHDSAEPGSDSGDSQGYTELDESFNGMISQVRDDGFSESNLRNSTRPSQVFRILAEIRASVKASNPSLHQTMVADASLWKHQETAVEDLVYQGLPKLMRAELWFVWSSAHTLRDMYPPGYYSRILARPSNWIPHIAYDIRKDIPRTMAAERLPRKKLERILNASALHNPIIGYCQGLNIVAATLLTVFAECPTLKEEDVFWTFTAILQRRASFYTTNMTGCVLNTRVMADLAAFYEPELVAHLDSYKLSLSNLCASWVLCLLIDAPLPMHQAIRVWDLYLLHGESMIFRSILAILRVYRSEILETTSSDAIFAVFITKVGRELDLNQLLEIVRNDYSTQDISRIMVGLREYHSDDVLTEQLRLRTAQVRRMVQQTSFNEDEIQRLWEIFLSPSPWNILQDGCISSVIHFQKAFTIAVFGPRASVYERLSRPSTSFSSFEPSILTPRAVTNGYMSGVTTRLFHIMDFHGLEMLDFFDFIKGVEVFTKSSRSQRLRMCFCFFDLKGDGFIDPDELRAVLGMFHRMYHGLRTATLEMELFCEMVWERVKAGLFVSNRLRHASATSPNQSPKAVAESKLTKPSKKKDPARRPPMRPPTRPKRPANHPSRRRQATKEDGTNATATTSSSLSSSSSSLSSTAANSNTSSDQTASEHLLRLSYAEFCDIIHLHPLVLDFFQLDEISVISRPIDSSMSSSPSATSSLASSSSLG